MLDLDLDDELFEGSKEKRIQVNDNFQIFPNPTSGILTVKILNEISDPYYLSIYDLYGHCLRIEKIEKSNSTINISEFTNGMYYIQLKNNETPVHSQKVIIQH